MSQLQVLVGPVQSLRARVPERYDDLVRPAVVLSAMVVLSFFAVLFGGGSSSASTEPDHESTAVAATSTDDGHATDDGGATDHEATLEPTPEDDHGAEPTVEPTPDDAHGSEAAAEATADDEGHSSDDGHGAEATAEPTPEATPVTLRTVFPTRTPQDVTLTDFVSSEFGVAFSYEVAPDPFVLEQGKSTNQELVASWLLVRQDELIANGGYFVGLPGMQVEAYEPRTPVADAAEWVRTNASSNVALGDGELRAAALDDALGVYYTWSGIHDAVSVAVQFDGRIWVFTATYRDDFEEIERSFETLLESVVFYQ